MTAKSKVKAPAAQASNKLNVTVEAGKSGERQLAEMAINPVAHGLAAVQQFSKGTFGAQDTTELFHVLSDQVTAAKRGDLQHQRAMLAGQASALNAIFTEMARRAGCNMSEYVQATQLYLGMALKAQAQCRSTIESLDRLSNGHVQTVKHVHVNEGGQAVIADQFHHHPGGQENGQSDEQPRATGTGAAGASPALSGPDPFGQALPVSSGEGKQAMSNARGQGKRRA